MFSHFTQTFTLLNTQLSTEYTTKLGPSQLSCRSSCKENLGELDSERETRIDNLNGISHFRMTR